MSQNVQPNLFGEPEAPPATASGLFAEVVFNRPLDHGYTYAVPERLRDSVAVGKRLLAPFGKGDRPILRFCVGLGDTGPQRAVKEIWQVIDEEVLLTPDLLRLTRWMADYYLCGWGQVLNAVVPAGARDQAGTREIAFLEAVPDERVAAAPAEADREADRRVADPATAPAGAGRQGARPQGQLRHPARSRRWSTRGCRAPAAAAARHLHRACPKPSTNRPTSD